MDTAEEVGLNKLRVKAEKCLPCAILTYMPIEKAIACTPETKQLSSEHSAKNTDENDQSKANVIESVQENITNRLHKKEKGKEIRSKDIDKRETDLRKRKSEKHSHSNSKERNKHKKRKEETKKEDAPQDLLNTGTGHNQLSLPLLTSVSQSLTDQCSQEKKALCLEDVQALLIKTTQNKSDSLETCIHSSLPEGTKEGLPTNNSGWKCGIEALGLTMNEEKLCDLDEEKKLEEIKNTLQVWKEKASEDRIDEETKTKMIAVTEYVQQILLTKFASKDKSASEILKRTEECKSSDVLKLDESSERSLKGKESLTGKDNVISKDFSETKESKVGEMGMKNTAKSDTRGSRGSLQHRKGSESFQDQGEGGELTRTHGNSLKNKNLDTASRKRDSKSSRECKSEKKNNRKDKQMCNSSKEEKQEGDEGHLNSHVNALYESGMANRPSVDLTEQRSIIKPVVSTVNNNEPKIAAANGSSEQGEADMSLDESFDVATSNIQVTSILNDHIVQSKPDQKVNTEGNGSDMWNTNNAGELQILHGG